MKFRKGDEIIVTAGKDKGKKGKVEKVFPKKFTLLIPNINVYKKFKRSQKEDRTNPGGVIEFSRPLPVANVALICPHCHKQTRIGYTVNKNQKTRFCKKCKGVLE